MGWVRHAFTCAPAPSDLALRNCLLTSDLTVRIGDYGLAHSNYKVGAALPWAGGLQGWLRPPDPTGLPCRRTIT